MSWIEELKDSLPDFINEALQKCAPGEAEKCEELRVRPGGVSVCAGGRSRMICGTGADGVKKCMDALTRGNMHALGDCIRQGYIPLKGGYRAGICGRGVLIGGEIVGIDGISGICIRISRDIKGAAGGVLPYIFRDGRAMNTLIISPPGLGKTTLLRDIARQLSQRGLNVAISDERGEIAGGGLDIGSSVDVMSMCPKAKALGMMVRSLRPDVIITDELGAPEDALAVADAIRCGASVIASAHAASFAQAAARQTLGDMLRSGTFERVALIEGPHPGENIRLYDRKGNMLC